MPCTVCSRELTMLVDWPGLAGLPLPEVDLEGLAAHLQP